MLPVTTARQRSCLRWKRCSLELQHSELIVIRNGETRRIPINSSTSIRQVSALWKKAIVIQSEGKTYHFRIPMAELLPWLIALRAETFYHADLSMEKFECLSVLGRGVFGKVTLCRHRDTSELVAIKSIHKNAMIQSGRVHTILSERAVLARVRHPFLTELRFAFQSATKFYIGLEYVPGGDLLGLIRRIARVPLSDAKIYIAELGFALDALHRAGIVYRDLKPDNVLIGADGHLKLADFGLAKEIGQSSTSSFCGTIDYIAPEIIQGRQYSYSVDWWALGVVGYELIFGESPFFDPNREKMLAKIVNSRPNFPCDADTDVVNFLQKLLIKDPAHRFAFDGLKSHKFFNGLALDALLEKGIAPSFVPAAQAIASLEYVDEEFTMDQAMDSLGSLADHDDPFHGFDFMNDDK
jgi:serine/threonine protein kinase